MTFSQAASSMRRLADAFDKIGGSNNCNKPAPMLDGDLAVGAASFLCYLRDLFTGAGKDQFSREEILVILETCSRDAEIFPAGVAILMWNMEEHEEEKP